MQFYGENQDVNKYKYMLSIACEDIRYAFGICFAFLQRAEPSLENISAPNSFTKL
ncbi:hypothetical protein L9F63_012603, partial [Diploptera punctata]